MNLGNLGRIVIYVEANEKLCTVSLPQEQLRLLMKVAEGLSENGALNLIAAPEGSKLEVVNP